EVAPEGLVGAEEAGIEEIKDGLQLGEAVLDGRAGESRAPGRAGRTRGARLRGRRVLDVLRLVEREVLPRDARQKSAVPMHEGVRRDEQVHLGEEPLERLSARASRTVMHDHAKLRGEALGLPDPVLGDGRRADEEGRADTLSGVARGEKRGEKLDRLAETHVVGETGAEAAREQET